MALNPPNFHPSQRNPHQHPVAKVFHWVNLLTLLAMMGSGLQIYNANPVFGGRGAFTFPGFLGLGGWLAGGRHWHFFWMWFYGVNLLCYGSFVLISRRWKTRYVSNSDFKSLRQGVNPKRKAYAWHRVFYSLLVPVLLLALLTGLGMYKPVQFGWIPFMFWGWHGLRIAHFLAIPLLSVLTLVHAFFALQVGQWKLVRSMFWA